jgi:hypothetical protein
MKLTVMSNLAMYEGLTKTFMCLSPQLVYCHEMSNLAMYEGLTKTFMCLSPQLVYCHEMSNLAMYEGLTKTLILPGNPIPWFDTIDGGEVH